MNHTKTGNREETRCGFYNRSLDEKPHETQAHPVKEPGHLPYILQNCGNNGNILVGRSAPFFHQLLELPESIGSFVG
jgi:hypothetical protein